jgi:hypothetical protein
MTERLERFERDAAEFAALMSRAEGCLSEADRAEAEAVVSEDPAQREVLGRTAHDNRVEAARLVSEAEELMRRMRIEYPEADGTREWVLFERARSSGGWRTGYTLHQLGCPSLPRDYEPEPDKVLTRVEAATWYQSHRGAVTGAMHVRVCRRCGQVLRDDLLLDVEETWECSACEGTGRQADAICGACRGSGKATPR